MDFVLSSLAFIEGLGGPEMVLILVIVLVLFGGEKLPDFARGLGKSIREFKKAATGVEEEFKRALEEDEQKKSPPVPTAFPPYPPVSTPPALEPPSPNAVLDPPPASGVTGTPTAPMETPAPTVPPVASATDIPVVPPV